MAITAELDRAAGVWVLTTGASLTLEEIAALALETDWEGQHRRLWDLRAVREVPETTQELRDRAEYVKGLRSVFDGERVAVVVATDLDFGLARMFQVFAEGSGVDYEIFRDMDAARDWLAKDA
jgi:hypothetical protein